MSNGDTYAKPQQASRGFAKSTWRLFPSVPYRIELAGANACLPFLALAMDDVGYGAALLWGGLP